MAQKVTDQTFDELVKGAAVAVVDISAPGCGPCKALAKTLEAIEPKYDGKVSFLAGDMGDGDVDDICMAYRIMSAPTLLYFKDGELKEKTTGASKAEDIEKILNGLL